MKIEEREIFGVKINAVDTDTAIALIDEFIASGEPHIVVTADTSCVVMAQSDPALRDIVNTADLVTADSIGIVWAAKKFGNPLPERVSGVDIVVRLAQRGPKTGHRFFLLGSAPGVTADAAEKLMEQYPGIQIAGTHHGYFTPEETPEVIERIRECKPDILFVAMGIPKQEKWITEHKAALGVPVSMGVGGSFDVISGRVNRAPVFFQRHGIEWMYRLASNPRKIGKCMTLPVFACMVMKARLFGKRR